MKRYLIARLLVWVPLGMTIWVLHFLLTSLDQTMLLLPGTLPPEHWLGFRIPGLGVVLAFAILLGTGVIAANILGQRLIRWWESILNVLWSIVPSYHHGLSPSVLWTPPPNTTNARCIFGRDGAGNNCSRSCPSCPRQRGLLPISTGPEVTTTDL